MTGTGPLWSSAGNVKPGDLFQSGHFCVPITDVTDDTHLTITPWPGSTISGASYVVWKVSQQRIVGETYARSVDQLVGAMDTSGFFVFVNINQTVPDPSLGDDGQYAMQPTTGKQWVKSGGAWVYQGIYKAFQVKGAWSGATAYTVGDVVALNGSSYACILDHTNHTPPNATYWQLLASVGATGATGATGAAGTNGTNGAGYGGTSTTSLTIGTGSKAFTTQAGLAYTNGARVRATATAGATGWLEGVATYSGTTLTITSDKTSGSGTGTTWNLNVAGEPGAGDLSSANNLSDVASSDQSRANLGIASRNYLLNPSGELSQRGLGSKADATYDFDQWLTLTQANPITASSVTDAENGTPLLMRSLQANASAQRFGRIQWLESALCRDLRGLPVALSARVRMSASTTLRYAIVEWMGTADSITKDVVSDWTNGTFTAGNFFTSTSTTIVAAGSISLTANTFADITALTGSVSGSMNNLAVLFWTDSTQAQNVTLDIGKVKLERGTVPTRYVAPTIMDLLRDCQRYYAKSFSLGTTPAQNAGFTGSLVAVAATASAGSISFRQYWPVRMRATPSVTTYNTSANDANWWDANANASRAAAIAEQADNSVRIVMNAATTAGAQHFIHWTADASL